MGSVLTVALIFLILVLVFKSLKKEVSKVYIFE